MDINKKRKHQRNSRIFYFLGYFCIVVFILFAITLIVYSVKKDMPMIENDNYAMAIMFSPLFCAAVFAILGGWQNNIVLVHHNKVKYWRHCRMFSRIIELETTNHHDKALVLYNKLKKSSDKDMLYGFIIGYSQNSNDPTIKKDAALSNFNDYKNFYRLDDIFK